MYVGFQSLPHLFYLSTKDIFYDKYVFQWCAVKCQKHCDRCRKATENIITLPGNERACCYALIFVVWQLRI